MNDLRPVRAVVVTGAAVGIGAAIAEELGRLGAFVVTLDANVTVDGSGPAEPAGRTTAERIVDAGGAARSINCSVTDESTVTAAFQSVVADFGALDAVVNVAGISRPTSFTTGSESDWDDVLSVHLDGYLTVLRAALPLMAAAGHGRIVGVTSGSGWRAANTGAYGCAKRAVASLTWQIGRSAPPGVTVNALSPIAATRMVTASLAAAKRRDYTDVLGAAIGGRAMGGIALGGFPPPEHLGPVGAFLAAEELGWCSGHVFFSAGAELALVAEPRLIEAARSRPVVASADVLTDVIPAAFVPAETSQDTGGGNAARFEQVFDAPGNASPRHLTHPQTCVVISDDPVWRDELVGELGFRGAHCSVVIDPGFGFGSAADHYARAVEAFGEADSVVVAIRGSAPLRDSSASEGWENVLDDHIGLSGHISRDAAWARAVTNRALAAQRPVRLVILIPATTPGGRSRAQAAAQLCRAARGATSDLVVACSVACESDEEADRAPVAALAGHLVVGPDTEALSGAELCVGAGWWGLRCHPKPSGTISFGGPEIPSWLNDALHGLVEGPSAARKGG